MSSLTLRTVLGHFGGSPAGAAPTPDQELLARFLGDRDETAFAALMERHGGMVLGVCRRILRNSHDAEEACQAVFLVLARRADSIRKSASIASWLHGVAWRAAHKLRTSLSRRHVHESTAATQKPTEQGPDDISWRELQRLVDEELGRMPKSYAAPLVLCYLEGRTQDEAARELGMTLPAVRGRLERGRDMLRLRLTRRGVTGASALGIAALVPSLTSAAVPAQLVAATSSAGLAVAAGEAVPAAMSAQVALLTSEILQAPLLGNVALLSALAGLAAAVLGVVMLTGLGAGPDQTRAAGSLEVWSQGSRLELPDLHVWSVAFSPDGKRLAAGSGGPQMLSGELRVWDAESREVLYALPTLRSVRCVAFAPDGKTLATAEHNGMARLRDADTGNILFTLNGHRSQIDAVAFSADGKLVATSGWDQKVIVWDTATGQEVRTLEGHHNQVFTVAFGNDGTLASGGVDHTARLWRAATGEKVATLLGHGSVVHWLAFSPGDGKTLATASWDKTVKLWDATNGNLAATLQGHKDPVLAVAFSPDGRTLASSASRRLEKGGDAPAEVILWDLAAQRARGHLRLSNHVYGLAFSPDGRTLATACWDGAVGLWQQEPDAQPVQVERDKQGAFKFVLPQAGEMNAAPPTKAYAEDYHPSLTGDAKEIPGLTPFGPDAGDCVKPEPAGLRIALPLGYLRQRPGTGVITDFGVKGDFEITASFEIVEEPSPGLPGNPTDIRLVVAPREPTRADTWHKSNQNRAELVRVAAGRGVNGAFVADATTWNNEEIPKDQWGNEIFNNIESHTNQRARTLKKSGQLRLVRSGSVLYFYTSEDAGQDFELLARHEFGAKDLKNVRLIASTGGPKASLDFRITDFQVRADALLKSPAPALDFAGTTPSAQSGDWPMVPLAIAAAAVAVVLLVGAWYYKRRRPQSAQVSQEAAAAAPAAIVFRCSSCGKQLKVKSARVGAKVKCPQCGKPTNIPQPSVPQTSVQATSKEMP